MHKFHAVSTRRAPVAARLAATATAAVLIAAMIAWAGPASAGGGADIDSVTFKAAEPTSYDHTTGGGHWDAGAVSTMVGSLEGSDFACGDIVSYFLELNVDPLPANPNSTVRVGIDTTLDSTGQSGVALLPIANGASVNYGAVGGSGPGGSDGGMNDDGGSSISNYGVVENGPRFTSGQTATATFDVNDLETAETVIVRLDAEILCNPGSNPTGNLQAALMDVDVIDPVDDVVNTGNQTVNFQKVGDIAGASDALLRITTTASTTGSCPGSDPLAVDLSTNPLITWCYVIVNDGTQPAQNAVLIDDNGTPGDPSDDITVTIPGLVSGGIAAGATLTATRTGHLGAAGSYSFNGTVTGDDGASTDYSASDPVTINATGTLPALPDPSITKTVIAVGDTCPGIESTKTIDLADTNAVRYCYAIANTGDADLLEFLVVDDMGTPGNASDDIEVTTGTLSANTSGLWSETHSFSATGVYTATVTLTGTDALGGDYELTDDTVVTVNDTRAAAPSITKTVIAAGDTCPGTDSTKTIDLADTNSVRYCYEIANTGDLDLLDFLVVDDMGTPGDPSDDVEITSGILVAGTSGVWVSNQTFATTGTYTATVTLTGNDSKALAYEIYDDTEVLVTEIAASPLGSVVGTVWFDRNKNNVRENGEPWLPGTAVELTTPVCGASDVVMACGIGADAIATTTTDGNGAFAFDNVPYGVYRVSAQLPGLGIDPWWDTDGGTDWRVVVSVSGPDPAVADMAAVGTGAIKGTVTVEGTTTPIPNATMACVWVGADGEAGTDDDVTFAATTGEDGTYEINDLPWGDFTCTATDPISGKTVTVNATIDSIEPVTADAAIPRAVATTTTTTTTLATVAATASGALPKTGGTTGPLAALGALTVGVGLALHRIRRRRAAPQPSGAR